MKNDVASPVSVLIFARAPIPGQAKTRLIPAVGARGAARLHRRMVLNTLQRMRQLSMSLRVSLCRDQPRMHPFFLFCQRHFSVRLEVQSQGDLGGRMYSSLAKEIRAGRWPILVGSDCRDCVVEDIEFAARALREGADCVLGPCTDGGYYLIAMRRPYARLFYGIEWGGKRVAQQTLSRARALQLRVVLLAVRSDVDTPRDLHRLLLR